MFELKFMMYVLDLKVWIARFEVTLVNMNVCCSFIMSNGHA